jgi:hypothetical protein
LNSTQTAEENKAELASYDTKVHKAAVEMAQALDSELRMLGIPFFVLKPALVAPASLSSNTEYNDQQTSNVIEMRPEPSPDLSKRTTTIKTTKELLSRDELLASRRRILELLQDLCKD